MTPPPHRTDSRRLRVRPRRRVGSGAAAAVLAGGLVAAAVAAAGPAAAAGYTYTGQIYNAGAIVTAPEGGVSDGTYRYIADQGANRIVKVSSSGGLSVVNDSYSWGSPRDLDDDGASLWVIDTLKNKLVQLSKTTGAVQKEFGSGGQFKAAEGVATDGGGLFVADTYHERIVRIDPSTGREIWSQRSCAGKALSRVRDVDAAGGKVYGVDTDNNRIVVLSASSGSCTAFGKAGTGDGEYKQPRAITFDTVAGLYISEGGTNRIQHVRLDGRFLDKVTDNTLDSPHGLFMDGYALAICDTFNYRVVRYDVHLTTRTVIFQATVAPWGFAGAESVAYGPDGSLYAVDIGNLRVQKFSPSGAHVKTIGGNGSGPGQFQFVRGITVTAGGTVVVTDSENSRIQLFDANLNFLRIVKPSNTKLLRPHYTVMMPDGTFWVTDTYNDRVVRLNASGNLVSSFRSGLVKPQGLAVDSAGSLYIANSGKNTVEKRSRTGAVLDVLARPGSGATQVKSPNALAMSGSTLYVADTGNDRIVVLTTSGGAVATFGGAGSSAASLDAPRGVDVHGSEVAVADYGNNRIALWRR